MAKSKCYDASIHIAGKQISARERGARHHHRDREAARHGAPPLRVPWPQHRHPEVSLDEWRKLAPGVSGHTLPCGHYVPEEAPEALLAAALPFLEAR
jgi:haloacetate dehalogenase